MDTARSKQCSKCGVEKQPSEFHKNSAKSDGLESSCKKCVSKRKANSYRSKKKAIAHRKKITERTKILDLSDIAVEEKIVENHHTDIYHLEALIDSLIFSSLMSKELDSGK